MDTEKNQRPTTAITQVKLLDGHWISGKAGTFHFKAKVYKESSRFGIDGGNVSKLAVWLEDAPITISYDRGWEIRPKNAEAQKIVAAILDYCRHVYGRQGDSRYFIAPEEKTVKHKTGST